MAGYTHPTYPDQLTKSGWDKNKGVIAKALGETGIGKACATAEGLFDNIDWDKFDIAKATPLGSSDEKYAVVKALKANVVSEHSSSVKPTVAALKALQKLAEDAATKLGKNVATKGTAKTATEMAKQADFLVLSLALNSSFFDSVSKQADISLADMEKSRAGVADNAKRTKEFLATLLKGLQTFVKTDPPDAKVWNSEVKQQGRNISNALKTNPDLGKKHLKTWNTKFQGFDWSTLGFSAMDPETLKTETKKLVTEVAKEAQVLRADL